ncbi:Cyclin-dependent kinase 10 [Coelomomyces lativittatus]|nr:Cyclin-dependent kinase 10 [Coelomomyces lativittatus]KAJ1516553.1 Cyclin-dependent kinase 10 [Coelomomyces lativittatus]
MMRNSSIPVGGPISNSTSTLPPFHLPPLDPRTSSSTSSSSSTSTSTSTSNSSLLPTHLLSVTQRDSKLPSGFLGACRNIDDFVKGKKVGEGAYGVVYRVQGLWEQHTHQYAVKRIRMSQDNDGFPLPSLREVSLLKQLLHPNIVRVHEVVVGKESLDKTYMLMEFCDRDLATLLDALPSPLKPIEGGGGGQ